MQTQGEAPLSLPQLLIPVPGPAEPVTLKQSPHLVVIPTIQP